MARRQPVTADELFRRYVETHDPAALAAVFDSTAPELFRVALHLTGSFDVAEDAVQTTYLITIERASTFDVGRSLLPWLLGILGNVVRKARARDRRAPDPARLAIPAATDPAHAAEAHELETAVRRALCDLSPEYQQILRLHLQHGLSATEIGEVLDRPAANVRAQLGRAMDALRRALPLGLASAAAIVSTTATGVAAASRRALARVRREILTRGAGIPSSTTVTWGWRGPALGLLAVAGVSLASWLWATWPASGLPERGGGPPAHDASSIAESVGAPTASPPTTSRTPHRDVHATTGALRVVVVGPNEERTPDIGVAAAVTPWHQVRTDAEGEALLEELPPGRIEIAIDRVPTLTTADVIAGTTTTVTATVQGATLVVRVVDSALAPLPGADVIAFSIFDEVERPLGVTDEAGELRVEYFTGGFRLGAEIDGRRISKPALPQSMTAADLTVQLAVTEPACSVKGSVEDRDGAPIPGAMIVIAPIDETPATDRLPLIVRAGADGRFATSRAPRGPVWVYACDPRRRQHGIHAQRHDPGLGGTTALALRLGPGAQVRGRVIDRVGKPIAGLTIDLRHQGYILSAVDKLLRHARATTDAAGHFVFGGLAPGSYRGAVSLGASRAQRTLQLDHGVVESWPITLDRGVELTVRTASEDGERLPDFLVRVWDSPGSELARDRTDARGEAVFAGLPDRRLLVTAQQPHFYLPGCWVVTDGVCREVVLTPPPTLIPTGRVRYRVLDAQGAPTTDATASLRTWGWPQRWEAMLLPAVDVQTSNAIPPARYTFEVRESPLHPVLRFGPRSIDEGEVWQIGDVALPATGLVRLQLAPPELAPHARVAVEEPDGTLRAVPGHEAWLRAGSGRLWISGDGIAPQRITPAVTASETHTVAVTLRAAKTMAVHLVLPDSAPRLVTGTLRVRAADTGEAVLRRAFGAGLHGAQHEIVLQLGLEGGHYVVEAEIDDEMFARVLRGEGPCDGPNAHPLVLALQ